MIRTKKGARLALLASGVPQRVWAERLGVHRSAVEGLVANGSRYQNGPMMARLIALLDSHDRGDWHWLIEPVPGRYRRFSWTEKPRPLTLRIDFERLGEHALSD